MSAPSTEAPLLSELPALRLLPVPPCAPPFDDELPDGASTAPGLPGRLGPLRALAPAPLRLVPDLPTEARAGDEDDDQEQERTRTPISALPSPRPVAHALVQGLLEVLSGVRPVRQLQSGTTPELFAQLEQVVLDRGTCAAPRPPTGAVRSLHVQARADGVAEVCATVRRGGRLGAVALRLEGLGGRWTCTELTCV